MHKNVIRTFINRLLRFPLKMRYSLLQETRADTSSAQKSILLDIIHNAKHTHYADIHHMNTIHTISDYQSRVPINDYDSLRPLVTQMMRGEKNILTSYDVTWYTKSAGTTGSSAKYLPVTQESLQDNHFKCSKDFITFYIKNNPDSKLFEGKGIALAGGIVTDDTVQDQPVGYISSILSSEKPWWGSYFMALGDEYLHLNSWDQKMDYIATHYASENITSLSGVGPWIIQLAKYLESRYKTSLRTIRPNLELIMSGGVSIDHYLGQYKQLFGKDIIVYNMYNASEGFYGFQVSNTSHDVLLATHHGIFYEFVPMDQYQGIHSTQVLTIDQVELETEYALLITTKAGLWRYITGDTIRFTSLQPPMIQITGRTKYYTNTYGEQVTMDQISKALRQCCQTHDAVVIEYTVGPEHIDEVHGRHQWIIEFETLPADLEQFEHDLDQSLQSSAYHYQTKRSNNQLLLPLSITLVPQGTFKGRMRHRGTHGGQFKVPNVWSDRKYLDEIGEYVS